jgi:ribosomal protein S18 acetylase RimI-like enzyme
MTLPEFEIIDVTPENEEEYDLFCKKSKKKEESYQNKLSWFQKRYDEGLRIKILRINERGKMATRGFVEYIPGENAWRPVNASNYMFIHCLWVVGKNKKKGYGRKLLELCIQDAKDRGKLGVCTVASDKTWLTGKKLFVKNGFEIADTAPPECELLAMKFCDVPNPSFPTNWDKRSKTYSNGMTIFYTDQCPYVLEAVESIHNVSEELGIPFDSVKLETASEVHRKAPSAFGTFGMVYNGELLPFNYISRKELLKILQS